LAAPFLFGFAFALPFGFVRSLLGAGFDDDAEADQEEHKHGEVENVGFLGGAFEFFPDQDAPESGDQGRALAEAVGDGGSGFAGGHQVNAVA